MSDIVTTTVNTYLNVFKGHMLQFLHWGQELFFVSVTITIVWLCLWYAFDKNSLQETMPSFLREFFIITLFYTVMLHVGDWLSSIPQTATVMGKTLASIKVDPSSIIEQGQKLGNLLTKANLPSGILAGFYAAILLAVANIIINFAFISVALELAITTLVIYFFISIAGFSLAFAAFSFTRAIARKTLDVVLANSMKLLSLYLIVAAGSNVFRLMAEQLSSGKNVFDVVNWVVAASLLFWMLTKNIPVQMARIFADAVSETRGTDAAALAMSAVSYARTATSAVKLAGAVGGKAAGGAVGMAKIAGSVGNNAVAHAWANKGMGAEMGTSRAIKGTIKDIASSAVGSLSDRFKHLGSKLVGGQGLAAKAQDLPSFAQRMHKETQAVYAKSAGSAGAGAAASGGGAMGSAGAPSSAGRKAAGSNATRSQAMKVSAKPKAK